MLDRFFFFDNRQGGRKREPPWGWERAKGLVGRGRDKGPSSNQVLHEPGPLGFVQQVDLHPTLSSTRVDLKKKAKTTLPPSVAPLGPRERVICRTRGRLPRGFAALRRSNRSAQSAVISNMTRVHNQLFALGKQRGRNRRERACVPQPAIQPAIAYGKDGKERPIINRTYILRTGT